MKSKASKKFVSLVLVFVFLFMLVPYTVSANRERTVYMNFIVVGHDFSGIQGIEFILNENGTVTSHFSIWVEGVVRIPVSFPAQGNVTVRPVIPAGYTIYQGPYPPWYIRDEYVDLTLMNFPWKFDYFNQNPDRSYLIDWDSRTTWKIVPSEAGAPTPPTEQEPPPTEQEPPPADNQPPQNETRPIPQFTVTPTPTDTGVWMEFTTVPNNRYGYRVFRATSATSDGISITDFPIMVNPAHSLQRIITFDPNVRPNRDYWYYIREVIEEARFNVATATLTPEVLGLPSNRVQVRTSSGMLDTTAERGFIMMFIGNTHMNVNNIWEGIDPPRNNTAPVINAGRTMVPIRAIVEAMGGTADWHAIGRRIDLRSHGNHVQMWLGQRNAQVNGATREMDIVPQIVNDRTLIPLRFVAEFLGAQVEWIGSQQMVVIVYELQ